MFSISRHRRGSRRPKSAGIAWIGSGRQSRCANGSGFGFLDQRIFWGGIRRLVLLGDLHGRRIFGDRLRSSGLRKSLVIALGLGDFPRGRGVGLGQTHGSCHHQRTCQQGPFRDSERIGVHAAYRLDVNKGEDWISCFRNDRCELNSSSIHCIPVLSSTW